MIAPSPELAALSAKIDDLEGEVMLAGFHGYSADHIAARLLPLYAERDRLQATPAREGAT